MHNGSNEQIKMQEININQTFNRIVKLLYTLGIWKNCEESASRERARKSFYVIYFLLLQMFLVGCACVANERNEIIFLWLMVVIVAVIGLKLVYLLWKENEILSFLYESTTHRTDANDDNQKMKVFLKFVNGYVFGLIVAAVFYNTSVLPIFSSEKRLPFFIRFSFEGNNSEIIYWISYVFVGTGIFYTNLCNLITSIIWYLMLNYAIEYEVLGNKLRNLGTHRTIKAARPVKKIISNNENEFLQDFIGLIKAHRNLIKYLHCGRIASSEI